MEKQVLGAGMQIKEEVLIFFSWKFYNYGEFGHPFYKCPKKFGATSSRIKRKGERRAQFV